MGWYNGSYLAENLWDVFLKYGIKEEDKAKLALELVEQFELYDCDTMEEASFVIEYLEFNENKYKWEIK